jgi:predicted dienelactone hydrolase
MTALALGGATVSPANFDRYCSANRGDEVCQPPQEARDAPATTMENGIDLLGLKDTAKGAGEGTSLPGLRAILAIAPNSQALSIDSFQDIHVRTVVVVGEKDTTVPSSRHAKVVADRVVGAKLIIVPGAGHYSFLATCTAEARADVGPCRNASAQAAAHKTAINAGLTLFNTTFGNEAVATQR